MKFTVTFCLALCLLIVMCRGVPVQRETLLGIEQPAAVVFEYQPQQLRRVARQIYSYGGYPNGGGYTGASSQASASATSNSGTSVGYPGGYPGGYGGYPGGFGGYPGGYGGFNG